LEQNVFPLFKNLFRQTPSWTPGDTGIVVSESGLGSPELWIRWRSTQVETGTGLGIPSWASEFECTELEPDRATFKDAVEKWAENHRLSAPWVREEVFSTCRFWLHPLRPRTWLFGGADPAWGVPPLPQISIAEAWSGEPWPIEKKRLLAQISKYGLEVKKHIKLISLYRGEVETKPPEHFRWAALYQCANLSIGEIIRDGNRRSESAVSKAIDSLLRTIELDKRCSKRGRRSKAKL
jgi:hypothetical protein